jgi:hypothetical protein
VTHWEQERNFSFINFRRRKPEKRDLKTKKNPFYQHYAKLREALIWHYRKPLATAKKKFSGRRSCYVSDNNE